MPLRCLTIPSRLVPDGTSGRRASYSERPSSERTTASRPSWRYCRRSSARLLISAASELEVLGVSTHPGADERAGRGHPQALALLQLVQRLPHQRGADPLALVGV